MSIARIRAAVITRWWLALLLTCMQFGWAAPGGIGGTGIEQEGIGGIGGTGIVGIGFIQRFGSIFVNGTEFELDAQTRYVVDGKPMRHVTLRTGDAVLVQGAMKDGKPFAREVRVEHAIVGSVDRVDVESRSLTVLGQTVVIGPGASVQSSHGRVLSLSDFHSGDVVSVSALATGDGRWLAYGVHRVTAGAGTETRSLPVLLRGRVDAIDSASQVARIDGLSVRLPDDVLSGLKVGAVVRLTGLLKAGVVRWVQATRIAALNVAHAGAQITAVGEVSSDGRQLSSPVGFLTLNGMPAHAGTQMVWLSATPKPNGTLDVGHVLADVNPMTIHLPAMSSQPAVTQTSLTGGDPVPAGGMGAVPTPPGGRISTMPMPKMTAPTVQVPSIQAPSVTPPSIQTPTVPYM